MSKLNILKKMFNGSTSSATKAFDRYGHPIQDETIDDHLLARHLERDRRKRVREELKKWDDRHWKEMTSNRMPHHKVMKKKGVRQLN